MDTLAIIDQHIQSCVSLSAKCFKHFENSKQRSYFTMAREYEHEAAGLLKAKDIILNGDNTGFNAYIVAGELIDKERGL